MKGGIAKGPGALGSLGVAILRTVHGGARFDCAGRNGPYRACLRLEARHLLARDPVNSQRFTSTAEGDAVIEAHDDALARAIDARAA